ncbi:MAG: hypothetical protein EOP32_17135 [Rhodococcus sp. (in: high G+C Gram-positive bacteria)]|nr:MAG: hypothetical protein EOP32_17135 [Rhodococcus sp. (in: high G+C Gram-positive bacteria)]
MKYAFDPEIASRLTSLESLDFIDYHAFRDAQRTSRATYTPATAVHKHDVAVPGSAGSPDVSVRV